MSDYDIERAMAGVNTGDESTGWFGWIVFAGAAMVINGVLVIIQALAALFNDEFFVATKNGLLTFDLTAWGWIHLIFGIVLIGVGLALFKQSFWSLIAGIIIVSLNLISQFAFLSAYPVWSVIAIVIDMLVLWALTVHGGESRI